MKPDAFLKTIVDPTLHMLADWAGIAIPVTDAADVLVLAIAGQESDWMARRQIGGPARGYWQFEKLGGAIEVMNKCPRQLSAVCAMHDIPFHLDDIFEAMAWNDTLACTMARLLLWQDPRALPEAGDIQGAWQYYLDNWRPGAPRPDVWPSKYTGSLALVGG